MNDKFEILNKFKGFGNPKGDFWFVGLEEAQEIATDNLDNILRTYNNEVLPTKSGEIKETADRLGNRFTKVYDIMSKIITGDIGGNQWKQYRDNSLLKADSNEFQMNLFPLGKPKLSNWPTHYNELFSITTTADYIDKVKRTRFKILKDFWDKFQPRITICFGTSLINEFKEVFKLSDSIEILFDEERIYFYPEHRTLITPFFDYRQIKSKGIVKTLEIIKPLRQ